MLLQAGNFLNTVRYLFNNSYLSVYPGAVLLENCQRPSGSRVVRGLHGARVVRFYYCRTTI